MIDDDVSEQANIFLFLNEFRKRIQESACIDSTILDRIASALRHGTGNVSFGHDFKVLRRLLHLSHSLKMYQFCLVKQDVPIDVLRQV